LDLLSVQGGVVDHDQRGALPAPARQVLLAAKARQLGAVREPGVPSVRLGKLAQMQREPGLAGPGASRQHSYRHRLLAPEPRAQRLQLCIPPDEWNRARLRVEQLDALRALYLRRQVQLEVGVAPNHGVAIAHDLNDGVVSAGYVGALDHGLAKIRLADIR
jgi:hypothetical protein